MATRLFIGGLNYRTTEEQLASFIQTVAPIAPKMNRSGLEIVDQDGNPVPSVSIILDRTFDPPRSKGFGFVDMADEEGTKAVIAQLDGQELDGRTLRINEAQERQPRPGGFGGDNRGNRPERSDRGDQGSPRFDESTNIYTAPEAPAAESEE